MEHFIRFLIMILLVIITPFVGGLVDGIDRVLTARMQGRKGPVLLQPFYDLKKLIFKQFIAVNRFQILLVMTYLWFVVFSCALFFGGCDMLLCFFSLTTAAMFLILASTSTHSPFATTGSHRELMQMMCYEPMLLITAIGFYLATGSFKVTDIVKSGKPAILYAPGIFIGYLFILTIKFRKSPFDLSTSHHAHQEVVKGVTTEMVGIDYAAVQVAEWYENVLLLSVVGLFFITKNPISYLVAFIVILLVVFLEILIDNCSARVKWKVMLKLSWGITLLAGGLNLLILELIK